MSATAISLRPGFAMKANVPRFRGPLRMTAGSTASRAWQASIGCPESLVAPSLSGTSFTQTKVMSDGCSRFFVGMTAGVDEQATERNAKAETLEKNLIRRIRVAIRCA